MRSLNSIEIKSVGGGYDLPDGTRAYFEEGGAVVVVSADNTAAVSFFMNENTGGMLVTANGSEIQGWINYSDFGEPQSYYFDAPNGSGGATFFKFDYDMNEYLN